MAKKKQQVNCPDCSSENLEVKSTEGDFDTEEILFNVYCLDCDLLFEVICKLTVTDVRFGR